MGASVWLTSVGKWWEACIDTRCETLFLALSLFPIADQPLKGLALVIGRQSWVLLGDYPCSLSVGAWTIRHLGAFGGKLRKEWKQVAFSIADRL